MKNKINSRIVYSGLKPLTSCLGLFISCLVFLVLPVLADFSEEKPKPNILWIIAEDMGPDMGCYGHPEVFTPHLDRIAGEGVIYTHAYTTAAVCSPSRSAFMTGMYQTSIGAHNHRSHRNDNYQLPAGVRVITDILRDGGYYTGNIVDLCGDPEETFYRGTGKTDWNFTYSGERKSKPFDTDKWEDLQTHQPFYAQVNFPESHRGSSWDTAHQHVGKKAEPSKVQIPPYYPDHEVSRKVWAQYLNAVMAFDKKVGFILDKLEQEGMLENTMVMIFGDNGRAMVRSKQWPYESGLHIPLLVRWPRNFPLPAGFAPGKQDSRLLSIIDVSATTLKIAGLNPPMLMQGRVFLGRDAAPPRNYVFGGRDRGDETVDRIRTVRDKRFRYIRNYYPDKPFLQLNRYKEWTYPILQLMRELHEQGKLDQVQEYLMNPTRPKEELYDLEQDPYEINNLAGNSEFLKLKQHLGALLESWIMETNDQGRIPESKEITDHWNQEMESYYGKREKTKIVY
jgi:N-sulfoglucosamine sulfohydrolase